MRKARAMVLGLRCSGIRSQHNGFWGLLASPVPRGLVLLGLSMFGFGGLGPRGLRAQEQGLGVPIGNGSLGAWVERTGPSSMVVWLEHGSLWDENGRHPRLGRLRIDCPVHLARDEESPGAAGTLPRIDRGVAHIPLGAQGNRGEVTLWVDVDRDRILGEVHLEDPGPVRLQVDPWRRAPLEFDRELAEFEGRPFLPGAKTPKDRLWARGELAQSSILWFHRNESSNWDAAMRQSDLADLRSTRSDPLLHRTVGGVLRAEGCRRVSPLELESTGAVEVLSFEVWVHGSSPAKPKDWVAELEQFIQGASLPGAGTEPENRLDSARERHRRTWTGFEDRSWIRIEGSDEAESIQQAYAYQRYLSACATGPGPRHLPAPPLRPDNPDARWGGGVAPWRETRLWAWSLLACGDGDRLRPLLGAYARAVPLARARTRHRHGHSGLSFPDPMTPWGLDIDPGSEALTWAHNLELLALGIELHAHNRDDGFFASSVLPIAQGVLTFYERHFPRNAEGQLTIESVDPVGAYGPVTNSMAELAGLHHVLDRLIELPDHLVIPQNRARWDWLQRSLPPIPTANLDGIQRLAPASQFGERIGPGRPQLEAVFPFERLGVGLPDLDLGRNSLDLNGAHAEGLTSPDTIHAACLGFTETARKRLEGALSASPHGSGPPRFRGRDLEAGVQGAQGFVPMIALQRMLLQSRGRSLHLLPAWPKEWGVDFRIHAPDNTVLSGRWSGGEWIALEVDPPSRRKDIVLHEPR